MQELMNSLPDPMKIDETALIIGAIFLVLLVVLNKILFQPLVKIMDERENRILEGETAQKKAEKTVAESHAAYQAAVVDARKKAQAKRTELLKETEMEREKIISAAKEKAMAKIQAAATDLDSQVDQAKQDLKAETQDFAERIVSSVLSRQSA